MKLSRFCQRLILGDHVAASAVPSLRNVVVWLFIALVALFLTHPSDMPASAFDAPVPWPAELGLEGGISIGH